MGKIDIFRNGSVMIRNASVTFRNSSVTLRTVQLAHTAGEWFFRRGRSSDALLSNDFAEDILSYKAGLERPCVSCV